MRQRVSKVIALALLWMSLGCAAQTQAPADADAASGFLQVVEPVSERIHVMRQARPNFAGVVGNVTIIEQGEGIVLVDSGSSFGDGARVVRTVRALSRKPVSAVIITHWHNDHPLGLAAIVEAWPNVSIISTDATRESLAAGRTGVPMARDLEWEARRVETLRGFVPRVASDAENPDNPQEVRDGWARVLAALPGRYEDIAGTHVVLPNRTFRDSLVLDDPNTPIEVRFVGRANTNGDAIVWLPRQRILVAGDIVVWPVPYNLNPYPTENIATLERLRAINFSLLIPGHGEVLRDKSYVDLLIAFMRAVNEEVTPLARAGTPLEEINTQVRMDDYAQRFAGGDPWVEKWFRDYSLTPLIENVYREARGEPVGEARP